jgi:hypothetical protein
MQEGEDLPLSLSSCWQLKGCECAGIRAVRGTTPNAVTSTIHDRMPVMQKSRPDIESVTKRRAEK